MHTIRRWKNTHIHTHAWTNGRNYANTYTNWRIERIVRWSTFPAGPGQRRRRLPGVAGPRPASRPRAPACLLERPEPARRPARLADLRPWRSQDAIVPWPDPVRLRVGTRSAPPGRESARLPKTGLQRRSPGLP